MTIAEISAEAKSSELRIFALSDPASVAQERATILKPFNRGSQELFMEALDDAGLFRFAQYWLGCPWYGERDSDPTHRMNRKVHE